MALQVPLEKDLVQFASGAGLGGYGSFYPKNLSTMAWSWAAPATPPGTPVPAGGPHSAQGWRVFMGDVDAGMYVKLKGEAAAWDTTRGTDTERPVSWANNGTGGIRVTPPATIHAFTGPRRVVKGVAGRLVFNVSLIPTPVKGDYTGTLEGKQEHYLHTRHYHIPYGLWNVPPASALKQDPGANTIILHQSNQLNPYINYPIHPSVVPLLTDYVTSASKAGAKVKLYCTVGQMSNHAPELFALKTLNGEVLLASTSDPVPAPNQAGQRGVGKDVSHAGSYLPVQAPGHTSTSSGKAKGSKDSTVSRLGGMGGNLIGNEWLEEHMVTGYSGGWYTQNPDNDEDASIGDNTSSRVLNFNIEIYNYLFRTLGLHGVYYDGFSGQVATQRRIRRMAADGGYVAHYDVHGRAFQNVELLPYVDSMWTCEGIDFRGGPAYWLMEIAALPFGTFGEMLGADHTLPFPNKPFCGESCANKWRGMLFGMTNRAGWNGHDPNGNKELWQLWDAFGIERASCSRDLVYSHGA